MALTDITKAIEQEAQAQVAAIEKKWAQRLDEAAAEWQGKIAAKRQEVLSAAKHKTDQKIRQSEFKLRSGHQAELLKTKQQLIDQVFTSAESKLAKLEDGQYVDIMEKLIKRLPDNKGELLSVKNKEDLLRKALKKSGKSFEVANQTVPGYGGFIFRSSSLEIDQTFPALINQVRDDMALEISQTLFAKII